MMVGEETNEGRTEVGPRVEDVTWLKVVGSEATVFFD